MNEAMFRELEKSHTVINFTPVDSGYRVRYLADGQTEANATSPNLEDSYTYIIQKDQET